MTCAVLVTAGGYGERMGSSIPKQYLDLEGIPVIVRTLFAFIGHSQIARIVLTVPPGGEDYCREIILHPFKLDMAVEIVAGGLNRQASVYNGLQMLADTGIVVIHDGVRPLVTSEIITNTIRAARSSGAALACVPVRETVKKKNGPYLETISRSDLWLAHTPQTFRTALIIQAHKKALDEGFAGTDDAALVERMGNPVTVVEDSQENIKITTPEDLDFASMLLRRNDMVRSHTNA